MSYQNYIKSEFRNIAINDILKNPPDVLLGISKADSEVLKDFKIFSVFDLGVSVIFSNAGHILDNSERIGSIFRKAGKIPATMLDNGATNFKPVTDLPYEPLAQLAGISVQRADALSTNNELSTIRDLALWPPYIAAKTIVIEALNPDLPLSVDAEAHTELVPKSGEFASERFLYSSIVMLKGDFQSAAIDLTNKLFDITSTPLEEFDTIRFGVEVTYEQSWFPKYVSKGQLLHSLPLAPGESTNVAVIDWTNKSKAATRQSLSETEKLSNLVEHTRAVSQIASSVATEFQSGRSSAETDSFSGNVGGVALLPIPGIGNAGFSGNDTDSSTHTVSRGRRSISTELHQNIDDATQQHSSSLRSQRAAVVSEVAQSESEHLSTRSVTNYNHMHALTVQYYEVVQIYETEVRLKEYERCIFVPMQLIDFTIEGNIFRYLKILQKVALDEITRSLLNDLDGDVVQSIKFNIPRFPSYRDQSVFLFPSLQAMTNAVSRNYNNLDDAEFIEFNYTDINKVGIRDLTLNNLSWDSGSLINRIIIELEDGTTVTVNAANNLNSPVDFGQIKAIKLITNTNYSPYNFQPNPPFEIIPSSSEVDRMVRERKIRLDLIVKHDNDIKTMNCGFFMADSAQSYNNLNLISIVTPPGLIELGETLNQNRLYYSQQVWRNSNPQNLIMKLAPLTFNINGQTINLVEYINPVPLKIVGNYVVYKFSYDDDGFLNEWLKENQDNSGDFSDTVAVPTGGVFAEAILGRFNSAEKIDVTRFFNWQDSPPPVRAPQIAALKAGDHDKAVFPGQATFDKPLVSIQSPVAVPDPTGMSAILNSIAMQNLFRDMSGAKFTGETAVAATGLAGAGSIAALQQAGTSFANALTAITTLMGTATSKDSIKTLSDVGALLNKKSELKKDNETGPADSSTGAGSSADTVTEDDSNSTAIDQEEIIDGALAGSGFGNPASNSPILLASADPSFVVAGSTALTPGQKVWNNFLVLPSNKINEFKDAAKSKWGVTPNNWYIVRTAKMKPFHRVYEYFHEFGSAKLLSPEFLHAVVMGENLYSFIHESKPFSEDEEISGFNFLGLDQIWDNVDQLITDGHVDAGVKAFMTIDVQENELGETVNSAIIKGYRAAIDLVSGELASRRDKILQEARTNGLTTELNNSDVVDFLTYSAFNNLNVAKLAIKDAASLALYTRKNTLPERTDNMNVRYNTLKRLAVSDWIKSSKVYQV